MQKRVGFYLVNCFLFLNVCFANAQKTVQGYYVTYTNDTVFCAMLKFKGSKEETNTYQEIQIINTSGSNQLVYPKDIYAYHKDQVVYRSVSLFGKKVFMKSLVQGGATLYYYSDEQQNGYYIFNRLEEKEFRVMDYTFKFSKTLGSNPGMNPNSSRSGYDIRDKDKLFIHFFNEYFKDCEPVVVKIKSEFYTKDDMIDIFEEYNKSCSSTIDLSVK